MGKMNFENCEKCGDKLRGAIRVRTKPKKCYKCLGQSELANNYELKRYCKEILNTPTEPGEDELVFEDDPRAVNEIEYGKVIKKSVGYVYSESSLGDVIVDTKIK